MRKHFFSAALFSAALVLLPATATRAFAADPCPPFTTLVNGVCLPPVPATTEPGCNPVVKRAMLDQASLIRARNQLYEQSIIRRPPSSLYLTCFDRTLARNARLGYIFSDVINPAPPPADTITYTATSGDGALDKTWGVTRSLVIDEYNIFVGTGLYDNALINDEFLPTWNANDNALRKLYNAISGNINSINSYLNGPDQTGNQAYLTALKALIDYVSDLPDADWEELETKLGTGADSYTGLLTALQTAETAVKNGRQATIGGFLGFPNAAPNSIRDKVNNPGNYGVDTVCSRLDDFWAGAGDLAAASNNRTIYTPEPGRYQLSLNYVTPAEFLQTYQPADPAVQSTYANVVAAANDSFKKLTPGGAESLWPPLPTLPTYASADDIVCIMAGFSRAGFNMEQNDAGTVTGWKLVCK